MAALDSLDEPGENVVYTEGVIAMAAYNGYAELPDQKPGVRSFVYDDVMTGQRIRIAYWPQAMKMAASLSRAEEERIDVPRQRVAIYWLDRFFREPQAFLAPVI